MKNHVSRIDFCPISLCNVIYKLHSKVSVNHMKPVMPTLVSDTHGVFVHYHSIFDNILVAHEVTHSLKGKRTERLGFVGG